MSATRSHLSARLAQKLPCAILPFSHAELIWLHSEINESESKNYDLTFNSPRGLHGHLHGLRRRPHRLRRGLCMHGLCPDICVRADSTQTPPRTFSASTLSAHLCPRRHYRGLCPCGICPDTCVRADSAVTWSARIFRICGLGADSRRRLLSPRVV